MLLTGSVNVLNPRTVQVKPPCPTPSPTRLIPRQTKLLDSPGRCTRQCIRLETGRAAGTGGGFRCKGTGGGSILLSWRQVAMQACHSPRGHCHGGDTCGERGNRKKARDTIPSRPDSKLWGAGQRLVKPSIKALRHFQIILQLI